MLQNNVFFPHLKFFFHLFLVLLGCLFDELFRRFVYKFSKFLLIFKARALIFELKKAVYGTFIEFKYYSSSQIIELEFEKITFSCYCLDFANFHFRAKLSFLFYHTWANKLHI